MGRDHFVKSIIHGMLIYSLHIYAWPHTLLCKLDEWIRNFVWSGDVFTRKFFTVAWNTVCMPFLS
jgi:hypothetical protein